MKLPPVSNAILEVYVLRSAVQIMLMDILSDGRWITLRGRRSVIFSFSSFYNLLFKGIIPLIITCLHQYISTFFMYSLTICNQDALQSMIDSHLWKAISYGIFFLRQKRTAHIATSFLNKIAAFNFTAVASKIVCGKLVAQRN